MENNNWIYYGAFLEEPAKTNLLEYVKNYLGISSNWKIYCDHMTIIYNDGSENAKKWAEACDKELGRRTVLTVTELGISDRAIAVKVSGYPTNNAIPHITVAVAPGAKPVESNQITNWKKLDYPISFSATLSVVLNNQNKK